MYEADAEYAPGTVVVFGGNREVTISTADNDHRVAGVISTNPSYLMNSTQTGEFVAPVALTGRVPCQVIGPVHKGDLMVSANNGHAQANNDARSGTVIGKALENFDGTVGVIEVVVGRM
jgi:phospholipase C